MTIPFIFHQHHPLSPELVATEQRRKRGRTRRGYPWNSSHSLSGILSKAVWVEIMRKIQQKAFEKCLEMPIGALG